MQTQLTHHKTHKFQPLGNLFIVFKIPKVKNAERERTLGMINAEIAIAGVAEHFKSCRNNSQRLELRFNTTGTVQCRNNSQRLEPRFNTTGTVQDRSRSDRPKAATRHLNRVVVNAHLRNPLKPSAETAR